MCVLCVWMPYIVGAFRGQKVVLHPLDLVLQVTVSCPTWGL